MEPTERQRIYWRTNLRYVGILLAIWFTVSLLFSVLLVETLDQVSFFGFKLGFWFAQQGSIFTFVVLIFVYAFLMNRLDDRLEADAPPPEAPAAEPAPDEAPPAPEAEA